jgi:hypothetical protein
MEKGSTDKQPTGIFGLKNEIITIYVDSKDNDLLPSIQFSQFRSHSSSWISSEISLKKGRNILKFNEFDVSSFKIETISGGPIYLINEYTSSEQSQNIKIYIEGGKLFPLFRVNEDEVNFKKILSNFCFNYNNQGESPQQNLLYWEYALKEYYKFDGIQFEINQPYYDIKNEYLKIHLRQSQPMEDAGTIHLLILLDYIMKIIYIVLWFLIKIYMKLFPMKYNI